MKNIAAFALKQPFLFCLIIFAAGFVVVNAAFPDPNFTTITRQAEFLEKSGQVVDAEKILASAAPSYPLDINLQHQYIQTHFELPLIISQDKYNHVNRDDNTISSFFTNLEHNTDPDVADIGYYGCGLINMNLNAPGEAIACFDSVKNRSLKYLNNSMGYALLRTGQFFRAEEFFRKEIAQKGNVSAAVSNLGELYLIRSNWKALDSLAGTPLGKKYVSLRDIRQASFFRHDVKGYAAALFGNYFSGITWWGFLAAFLIMGSWVMYLRKLDVFETEKWMRIILCVGMGAGFTFFVFPVSDILNNTFHFRLNGTFFHDFLYSVFGIGAVEEFFKFVPLLLMLLFTKAFNEPYDYIKFASLSAVGFAFTENLEYFHSGAVQIIHGRMIASTVHHMFNASIIGYGLLLNRYRWKKNPVLIFFPFFLLAAFSHGFYDFWLISKSTEGLSIITVAYLFFSIVLWTLMLNNALNNSSFFTEEKKLEQQSLRAYLIFTLLGVLLFEFVAQGIIFGHTAANTALYTSVKGGTYLIAVLVARLSFIRLRKGEWRGLISSSAPPADYSQITGARFTMTGHALNNTGVCFLPNTGTIERNIFMLGSSDWLVLHLDRPANVLHNKPDYLLIRTVRQNDPVTTAKDNFVMVYSMRKEKSWEEPIWQNDILYCGTALMKLAEPAGNVNALN